MQSRTACLVDEQGYYTRFVMVHMAEDGTQRLEVGEIQPGEQVVFDYGHVPSGMILPRWTGTVWEETGTKTITEEDLEQLRASKLQMVNSAAQQAIYTGITIGENTFALTEVDQINISTLAAQLQAALRGEESSIDLSQGVPYHADGELCRHWPAEEFTAIAQAATAHVFYHQTYCNHLRAYIKEIVDYEELEAVRYGMELPPELEASMATLLGENGV